MRSGRHTLGAVLVCMVVLVSCRPPLRVQLASNDERLPSPAFRIFDPEYPQHRPRYVAVEVLEKSGDTVWYLRSEPFGDRNSVALLVYGVEPTGFITVVPAKPLEQGRMYRVAIIGEVDGSLRFKVEPDGRVLAVDR